MKDMSAEETTEKAEDIIEVKTEKAEDIIEVKTEKEEKTSK
jgi:hypothetical protein